jgi:hypothetical protein
VRSTTLVLLRLLHLQRGVRALTELVKVTVAHGSLSPRVSQAEICSHYSWPPISLQPEQGRFPSMVIWGSALLSVRHYRVHYCLPVASTIYRLRCPAKNRSFSVLPYCLWPKRRYHCVPLSLLNHQLLALAIPTVDRRLQPASHLASVSLRNTPLLCTRLSLSSYRNRPTPPRCYRQKRQRLSLREPRSLLQSNNHGAHRPYKQLASSWKGTYYLTSLSRKQSYGRSELQSSG